MSVYSIAYASRATRDFTREELQNLSERAGRRNALIRITGYLCHQEGLFFQYLEGPMIELPRLMDEIREDERHNVFNEIDLGRIDSRNFPDWSMRMLSANGMNMIQMEDVLRQVLTKMTESDFGRDRLRNLVLPMVARIAERQAMLKGQVE